MIKAKPKKASSCTIKVMDAQALLESVPVGTADLVFLDPPFNIGEDYGSTSDDAIDSETYRARLSLWLRRAAAAVKPTGSLWVHLPDQWVWVAAHYLNDVATMTMENWIVWHYRFGQCRPTRFINSKCHGLWFSKGDPKVNADFAKVPSDRAALYNDKRAAPDGRMDLDVWGFDKYWGRVQGNNKERRPLHPNQLPEKYIERIIGTLTDPDDLVVDPFVGSGTVPCVATSMGRRFLGSDINPDFVRSALDRVEKGPVRLENS